MTAKRSSQTLLFLVLISLSIHYSDQLQSSQAQTLLRIQFLLDFPPVLGNWNDKTDFCSTEPTPSLTVVCYDESITQLHIIGNRWALPLPQNFSMDSFVTTLVKLPILKVLTLVSLGLWGPLPGKISRLSSLEILNVSSNFLNGDIPREFSLLTNLQALVLNKNMFSGQFPDWLTSLSGLTILSLNNNSLKGSLPMSLGNLEILRILSLSHNNFSGEVPDLGSLTSLQVLDLENNSLGPQFPRIGSKLVTLILKRNGFSSRIPDEVSSYKQLQKLDISENRFVGPFPTKLLSLPSITSLNISRNRFTGMLFENLSCGSEIKFVDLSSNLLTGKVPNCLLSKSKDGLVLYNSNCLTVDNETQHPISLCQNEALAVGILPHRRKPEKASQMVLALSIIGGIIFGILMLGLAFVIARRIHFTRRSNTKPTRLILDNASTAYSSKLLSNARYISQSMKLGPLGIPSYRTFSLEEIEEATNNFDTSTFLGDGSQGQMYRGQLRDGSFVTIRCLKLKKNHNTQSFMHHIELISKLRHRHLVSALGHCFECYLEDSSVSRLFLIFEYIPNGNLRSWVSEGQGRRKLAWAQRISAAIGVAKGLQFLHTGIVPGLFLNNLKITDALLDHNLVAKISSYNLPFLADNMGKGAVQLSLCRSKELTDTRGVHEDKLDVYDFGVIILELIVGRPMTAINEVKAWRDYIGMVVTADDAARRRIVDPFIQNAYSDESMKTMMQICARCLVKTPEDRPSVEDLLWNLQFAAQVQDPSHSSDGSPITNFQTLSKPYS